jgi:uroporphyrinogen-III synthase
MGPGRRPETVEGEPGMDERVATTWLLTRAAEDAVQDAEVLSRAQVRWALVPCIECVPKPWPSWPERDGTPVHFFTSRRAAAGMPVGSGWRTGRSTGLIAATAPSTAAWLTAHGHPVDIEGPGGAFGLARAVVREWQARGRPSWHVRYPTSDAGLDAPEQEAAVALLETVGPVDRAVVYETRPAESLADRLAPYLLAPYSVTFSSPTAVKAFLAACPRGVRRPDHVICFGGSTVRAWDVGRPADWPAAVPAVRSVVETILSHQEGHP